jgi:hypothetical protein
MNNLKNIIQVYVRVCIEMSLINKKTRCWIQNLNEKIDLLSKELGLGYGAFWSQSDV